MLFKSFRILIVLGLLLSCSIGILAQETTSNEFWPQVNAYFDISPDIQVLVTANERLATDSVDTSFRVGPMVLFHLPLAFNRTPAQHHEEEHRFVSLAAGYLYITPGPGGTGNVEQRGVLQFTARLPSPGKSLLMDRNELDLRWISGAYYWRYRNQLTLQRDFSILSHAFTAFANGEVEYYNKYDNWYRTDYGAGVRLPVGNRVELQPYYLHENTSNTQPAHTNVVGIIVSLFFHEQ
jgi:Protein of unknown function (DUF2490)